MSARSLALLALAGVVTLGACRDQDAQPPVVEPRMAMLDSADQVLLWVRYNLSDAGIKRGELFADTAFVFDEGSRLEFRKVRIEFNTKQGTKDGTMTAERGIYNMRMALIEGYGNVKIVTLDGKTLSSPYLRYNQASNEIATDSAFVAEDGRRIQRGIGLRTDPQLSRVQILRAASGEVKQVPVPQGRP